MWLDSSGLRRARRFVAAGREGVPATGDSVIERLDSDRKAELERRLAEVEALLDRADQLAADETRPDIWTAAAIDGITAVAKFLTDPFRLPQSQLFELQQQVPLHADWTSEAPAEAVSGSLRLPRILGLGRGSPSQFQPGGVPHTKEKAPPKALPTPQLFNLRQHEPRLPNWRKHDTARQASPGSLPSIAIVTPSYNQAHFIGDTIESVIGQGYPTLRYLVRDGGSTDSTQELLGAYGDRLNWRSELDGGQARAIKLGFEAIEGEIMGYLNSDDVLTPGSLFRIAEAFERNPEVDVIYSHRIIIDERGMEIGRWCLPAHDPRAIFWADFIPQETMFWRRRVWETVGGIDPSFRFAMDWDFILRAHHAGFRFARINDYLGCFRVHSEQKTTAQVNIGDEEVDMLRNRYLGFSPGHLEINEAIQDYMDAHRRWLRRRRFGI